MSPARPGEVRPVWRHPGTAQEPRRRPTQGPTEAQDSPTRRPEASTGAQTRLGTIWKRFRAILVPPEPRKTSKSAVLSANFVVFAISLGSLREAQMSPRRAPGGPRSGPRAPKTAPRAARSAPRGAQDHPGAPQERTQGAQAVQTPPGSPSGAHFGLILGPPGPHFRAF